MDAARDELPAIPGYRVVRALGRGGSGEVFEATRVGPGGFRKHVALKRLLADRALSGRARARFFQEAQLTSQLEHPNLVRVHDVIEAGGDAFIVMELLRGATLAAVAEALRDRGPVPWWVPFAIAAQALDGLAYAHTAKGEDGEPLGLVHRDLAPRNLFVCSDGTVKVLDFGIAKQQAASLTTSQGQLAGTVEFLSPEQARGERVDLRSDLFQIGASIFWTFAGKSPHGEGTTGELVARAAAGIRGEHALDLPAPAAAVLARALSHAPADRYADAATSAEAIREVLGDRTAGRDELARIVGDIAVGPEPKLRTISATGDGTQPIAAAPAVTPARVNRRARWTFVFGALAVAALAAGIAYYVARRREMPAVAEKGSITWQRLTPTRGHVSSARFAPNGDIVYAASGEGQAPQIGVYRGAPHPESLKVYGADILATAADGQLLLKDTFGKASGDPELPIASEITLGTTKIENAHGADLDGDRVFVTRDVDGQAWIERGGERLIASTTSWYSRVRISPWNHDIAVVEHPRRGDSHGFITIAGPDGTSAHRLGRGEWDAITGIAWAPDHRLVISARRGQAPEQLVELEPTSGAEHWLAPVPGGVQLLDIAPDGRMLVAAGDRVVRWIGDLSGRGAPRSFGAYASVVPSGDGAWLVAIEHGDSPRALLFPGANPSSAEPVALGTGVAAAFSPDGARIALLAPTRDRVSMVTADGASHLEIALGEIHDVRAIAFATSGQLLVDGVTPARSGLWIVAATGGTPGPFGTGELHLVPGITTPAAPDGHALLLADASGAPGMFTPDGSHALAMIGVPWARHVVGWTSDSRAVFVADPLEIPSTVYRIEPGASGEVPLRPIDALDQAITARIDVTWISPDGSRMIARELELPRPLYLVAGAW